MGLIGVSTVSDGYVHAKALVSQASYAQSIIPATPRTDHSIQHFQLDHGVFDARHVSCGLYFVVGQTTGCAQ